ncbi:MAG: glycosidase, partial [Candidatus Bathyarchaeia archaeon]
ITPKKGSWDAVKNGVAAPPLKTKEGWILLYHGVDEELTYRVGAVLLNPRNPLEVIARTDDPVFEPEETYERIGIVNNVVFPCGAVVIGDTIYMYYGAADRVIGVATLEVERLLRALLPK